MPFHSSRDGLNTPVVNRTQITSLVNGCSPTHYSPPPLCLSACLCFSLSLMCLCTRMCMYTCRVQRSSSFNTHTHTHTFFFSHGFSLDLKFTIFLDWLSSEPPELSLSPSAGVQGLTTRLNFFTLVLEICTPFGGSCV